ncbi:MAG TPA: hypothetical protein VH519_05500 [Hyphomicrobiaceae bacterium]|jgi:hypothetical protein
MQLDTRTHPDTMPANGHDAADPERRLLTLWTASIEAHREQDKQRSLQDRLLAQEVCPGMHDNRGGETLTDPELHKATKAAVVGADVAVHTTLAGLIDQVLARELWRRYNFPSFGAYCLAPGRVGLGISTNQRLYLLRCCLDVHGRHLKAWSSVLTVCDAQVRVRCRKDGTHINTLKGKSLRALATAEDRSVADELSYLPSTVNGPGSLDSGLMRLHRLRPDLHTRVVEGALTLPEAQELRKPKRKPGDGPSNKGPTPFFRVRRMIQMLVGFLSAEQKAQLREMLA